MRRSAGAGLGGARRGWRGGRRRRTTGALVSKDGRFRRGEGEADVGGTLELGRRIEELLEQIVF
jgi:hypothetical protein